jgi:hypothetical protein
LTGLAAFGALRVALARDPARMEAFYGSPPAGLAVQPSSEFYDYLDSPWDDPAMRAMRLQLERAVARLRELDIEILYADVLASPSWPRKFLACRGRAEWKFSPGIIRHFGADGLILPALYAQREEAQAWLGELRAEKIAVNAYYAAFRIPRDVK